MPTWQQIKKDPSLLNVFYLRQKIIIAVREFFQNEGFLEVFTPILQPAVIPESYHDLFSTEVISRNLIKSKRFLIPSPEVSIKKLLSSGVTKCFEITKVFRNRESGNSNNYEFTILEWYRTNANYMDILKDAKNLFKFIGSQVTNKTNLSKLWQKISVIEAIKKYSNLDFDKITDKKNLINPFPVEKIAGIARKKGYVVGTNYSWEEYFNQIYLNEIEPEFRKFKNPILVYDYPARLAALAKLKANDPRLCERFEIYVNGLELADCCSELNDYQEQKRRFEKSVAEIKNSDKNQINVDYDFLDALKSGLPPCSGIALGIDRLVMLFANLPTIGETLLSFV